MRVTWDEMALADVALADGASQCSGCDGDHRWVKLCGLHAEEARVHGVTDRTQHHISVSELNDWRQCKFKWSLGWDQRWRTARPSRALRLGSAWHNVMEAHYNRDDDALRAALAGRDDGEGPIESGLLAGLGGDQELAPVLEWMYEGYLECWGEVADEPFELLSNEQTQVLDLPGARGRIRQVKVKLDLLCQDDDGVFVLDHKTGGAVPDIFDLEMDPQFTLYIWAARQMGHDVRRGVRSFARTKKLKREMTLDERFTRQTIPVSRAMVETCISELLSEVAMIERSAPTRSPGKDCHWKCSFREACQASYRRPDLLIPVLESTGHEQYLP